MMPIYRLTCQNMRPQQGVALLTVLLLVVAITVVAGSMLASQKLSLRQYALMQRQNQVMQDVQAGAKLAVAMIEAEAKINTFDAPQDAWAQPTPAIPLAVQGSGESGGLSGLNRGQRQVQLSIQDGSARFNLNNLYHDGAIDKTALAGFKQLLTQVGLEPNLAYAVLDWQDPDGDTSAEGGAEANDYAVQATSLRTQKAKATLQAQIGNQPFITVDELASVQGFDVEAVSKLRPYVTAVPYFLPINVNTADAVVMQAVINGAVVVAKQNSQDKNNNEKNKNSENSNTGQNGGGDSENDSDNDNEADNSNDSDDTKQTNRTAEMNLIEVSNELVQTLQKNPAMTMEDALQAMPFSSLDDKVIKVLTPMLTVESQAFWVLIDVHVPTDGFIGEGNASETGSETSQVTHRYATTWVSKLPLDRVQTGVGQNEAQTGLANSEQQSVEGVENMDNSERVVQSFGLKLWTYRPSF